jgi:hypothetical protein
MPNYPPFTVVDYYLLIINEDGYLDTIWCVDEESRDEIIVEHKLKYKKDKLVQLNIVDGVPEVYRCDGK